MANFFFTFFFSLFSLTILGQDLQEISEDISASHTFSTLTSYKSDKIEVENVFEDSLATLRLNEHFFCIDEDCWQVNSPVYFLRLNNELNYSFRLNNGYICILYLINDILQTIEIFEPANKIYIQFLNLKEEQ
jgi:hypothetical protein